MKIINNIRYVLGKAFSWKVVAWFCCFLALTLLAEKMAMTPMTRDVAYGAGFSLAIINLFLLIAFTGFLFLSAVGAKENQEKPLGTLFSRTVFNQGAKVIASLFVASIPLFMVWGAMVYFEFTEIYAFFNIFILIYVVLGLLPTWLQIVQEYPNYSVKNSLWAYFKKNASSIFACVFWTGVLLLAWSYVTQYVIAFAQTHSTSPAELVVFVLFPFFTLFYVMMGWSLLSGIFARAHTALTVEGEMQKPVMDEAPQSTPKAAVSTPKKAPKKNTHKKKPATRRKKVSAK